MLVRKYYVPGKELLRLVHGNRDARVVRQARMIRLPADSRRACGTVCRHPKHSMPRRRDPQENAESKAFLELLRRGRHVRQPPSTCSASLLDDHADHAAVTRLSKQSSVLNLLERPWGWPQQAARWPTTDTDRLAAIAELLADRAKAGRRQVSAGLAATDRMTTARIRM